MTADDYSTERLEEINGILWQIITGIDADKHNAAEESASWHELDEQGAAVRDAYRIIFQIQKLREPGELENPRLPTIPQPRGHGPGNNPKP